jgi:hypothetical protein
MNTVPSKLSIARQQLNIDEQAKYDVTMFLRNIVDGVLVEWGKPTGQRRRLSLFLEFNFPFVDKKVQKILMERHPQSNLASTLLKQNPWYPIHAYLFAEQYGWIALGEQNTISSLFPLPEMTDWIFVKDLVWFSSLLAAVGGAIIEQIRIAPTDSKWGKRLQAWRLDCDRLQKTPKQWLEGTSELKFVRAFNKTNDVKITPIAGQENSRRRKVFSKWTSCWQAELRYLEHDMKLRLNIKGGQEVNRLDLSAPKVSTI